MLVSWNTTNQCNMFCDHCYRDAGVRSADELTTAQAKQLIREIKQAGFQIMIFSGGEPLMRPDIFELGSFATQQGLRSVMGTNGSLITPEIAVQMKQSGFMAAGISLD
ncbi:MAG: radical SAM protein, partial [Syntrophomonadaceae bacterium]|nr:radical SAM protein [Syntrophomonadaceae bacterium]